MTDFLKGKTAIVTGATRGIGRAIAASLATAGAGVMICGRSAQQSEDAAEELSSASGSKVVGQACDVADRAQVKALFEAAEREFGGVDIVINNAGIGIFKAMADLTEEDWHRVMEINLSGAFYCSQEAVQAFRKRGAGYVIQIGSLAGRNPFATGSLYNASKFGLRGFSEAMMLDHRQENVRVSLIAPGSVDTDFGGPGGAGRSDWKIAPEDIAEIVMGLLRMPERTLVSYIELRPAKPKKG